MTSELNVPLRVVVKLGELNEDEGFENLRLRELVDTGSLI